MAKKKTTGTDIPVTSTPAAPRRRSTKNVAPIATPGQAPAIETAPSAVTPIDTAADMSSRTAAGNGYHPSDAEIAEAAYQRYLNRGGQHGSDWEDWLEAERELRSRR